MKKLLLVICFGSLFGNAQDIKNVLLIDQWTDTLVTAGPEEVRFNDIWAFQQNGQDYLVMGSTEGAHFFSVFEDSVHFIQFKPGAFQGPTVQNRDYKTYQNYLYAVCDEGLSTLQIYDLSYLPDSVSLVAETNTYFQTCHNLFIDTLKGKMYACGPNGVGMKVFDLTNPTIPLLVHDFTDVSYVHDCHVYADTAFLNCGVEGLYIYDFGGGTPIQKGILNFYPNQGYNHSGWLSKSKNRYVFTDEDIGRKIKLCRLGDLSKIQVHETFGTDDFGDMIAHNAILLDELAVVSYYNEGLRIFDVSTSPVREIGAYDTYEQTADFKMNGAWGVAVLEDMDRILVSDRQSGLFLFKFPIKVWENGPEGNFVTNTPFIDENGILISREHFHKDELYFTVTDTKGSVVYYQQNYNNWFNIPLDLSPGTYIYGIFDSDRQKLEGGKFVKAN